MSRDQAMNSHLYSYEADSRHYLNRITVGGKILQKVTYVASGGPRKVAKVQDEIGGTEEEYSYEGTAPRITVTIAKKESDGSKSKEVLSYEKPANGSDEPHLSKRNLFESETPGEIRYRACCELPEVIKIGEDEARFEYDESNRLVKKQTPTFTQTIEYEDGQSLAVASVTTKRADTGVATTVRAQHDKNGNLTGLTLPDGRKFALKYDSRNRLSHYSYANPKRNLDEMFIVKYDENTNDLIIANPEIGLARIPEDYDLFKNLKSTSPVAKAMTLYSAALVRLNEAREQLLVTLSYNPEEDL
ncbi:MAG: hypothetical protein EBX52_14105 [Proteobacteria bacterium]|nr:hypothetical protein [Pseudomonadota bacterium]